MYIYLQVSDLKTSRKTVPPQLGDVIVAEVQRFHRHQFSGSSAVYNSDLIVMSEKERRTLKTFELFILESSSLILHRVPVTCPLCQIIILHDLSDLF